ncbi:hypoxia up-regulated protein 1 isoform X3 [Leptopilina boulardi]|uniref:hypoxia up-regulated protein 1 isoform X3 n=1 Tax=Leptopilina boulardi TaxID=63433 RepID=UPI0021F5A1AE|nr:hypoxia up-regulated protein 1 isoform X3 [Leptopilina boulardi]
MKSKNISLIALSLFTIFLLFGKSYGLAVMSVDIGSEWFKVAIVSPGVPMEIALNKESKRKTPVAIAFRNEERTFGEDAQVVGVRFPQYCFSYILDLLGKTIDNPIVQLYKKRFPYHNIVEDKERNTIMFQLNENTTYTPEELLAQIFHHAKEMAEKSAGQTIKEAVITVPGFFNQAERKALLKSAELAGIKVLQLFNDYSAVALNYGIFHSKNINDTAHYIMFYDMGASTTTATIVSYQNVKTKERGFLETHPQVSIVGVGYDRTLGGIELQIRLQEYFATEFDAMKKTSNSVFKNPRAMAKLFKEAGRVKLILSANSEFYAQVEGLIDDHDFKLLVTREKLEELCADLFERALNPIKDALKSSALTMDLITQVVLVGAGTRVPKIQDMLSEFVKIELSKNINTDEAATLGAVYKAADLSQGFKVKKFISKDAVLFPIQVVFDRNANNKVKQVKRTLFNKMNAFPQKKILTFNKHTEDFEFNVNYADLDHLPAEEIKALGNLNISVIKLKGVSQALEKHAKETAESKGIKAHFSLDESGILHLINTELVSEKTSLATEEEEGSEDKETVEKVEEPLKENIKPVHEEPEYPGLKKEADEKEKKKNDTKPAEDKSTNKTEKVDKEKKPTIITLKEPIDTEEIKFGPLPLEENQFITSLEKIKALNEFDKQRTRRETALNNLESFVIDAQQHLETEEYKAATTPEDSEKIIKAASEISEWLYEDGFDATADVYEEKLASLKALTNDLYERVFEHRERPEVIKGMKSMLNGSRVFLHNMRNLNKSSEIFTEIEIETLDKVINETQDYFDLVTRTFAETPLNAPVPFKVRDMANKMALLDREVKYLLNKAKIWKPKQEPVVNATDSTNANNKTKDSNSESLPESDKKNKTEETKTIPENSEKTDSTESQEEKLVLESSDTTTEEKKTDEEEETIHQEL